MLAGSATTRSSPLLSRMYAFHAKTSEPRGFSFENLGTSRKSPNDDLRDPADQKKVKINRRQPWDQGWYLEKGAQRQEHLTEQRNHEKNSAVLMK